MRSIKYLLSVVIVITILGCYKLPFEMVNSISSIHPKWVDSATIDEDGFYNGFLQFANSTGPLRKTGKGVYKKSSTHAAAGWAMLTRTHDAGRTFYNTAIRVNGKPIWVTNYSFNILASGRLNIVYRDTSNMIKVAYRDDIGLYDTSGEFTQTQIMDLDVLDQYKVYTNPHKLIITSEGNTLVGFYRYNTIGTHPSEGVIYESKDNGQTYQYKSTVFSHSSAYGAATLGDWRGNEFALILIENTGVDSTSKYITLTRIQIPNDGGTSPFHIKSADGCKTWTTDLTKNIGAFTNDIGQLIGNPTKIGLSNHLFYPFLAKNAPMDGMLHKGKVLIVHGERNLQYGYSLKWTTYKTIEGAFRNRWDDVERPTFNHFYNARILGRSTDCAYAMVFSVSPTSAYVSEYDVSLLPPIRSKALRRTRVQIRKLY